MTKYRLTPSQKEEIRRLTQLANRRIRSAEKQYREAGKMVLPKEVVGDLQVREKWHTPTTPLSRSVVFDSKEAYERRLRFLRSFDPKAPGQTKPSITEYTTLQRSKTAMAVESSLGTDVPLSILEKINRLSAPELAEFWRLYSNKARTLGVRYSSLQAMQETLNEMFPEDIGQFEGLPTRARRRG